MFSIHGLGASQASSQMRRLTKFSNQHYKTTPSKLVSRRHSAADCRVVNYFVSIAPRFTMHLSVKFNIVSLLLFAFVWSGHVRADAHDTTEHATNLTNGLNRESKADGLILPDELSCKDKCDTIDYDSSRRCQCHNGCAKDGNCCRDYREECLSCIGRCHFNYDKHFPCQCNKNCHKYKNCCPDNTEVCWQGEPPPLEANITDADIARLTEELWRLEGPNNCADLIRVNLQSRTSYGATVDSAPQKLLQVDPSAYRKTTVAKILPLYDNYIANAGTAEIVTRTETSEEGEFLDAILATPIMQRAEDFLLRNNFILSRKRGNNGRLQDNPIAFRDALRQIWFEMYSREGGIVGSSGFEHIFLGETKNRQVSGFHNWIYFSKEESKNDVNYFGHLRNFRLGPKGSVIKHNFKWNGVPKPVSTMFIGTSPELEMALYTICFYVRPGGKCAVSLNDRRLNIQTHFINRQGKKYVASGYPDI